MQLGLTFNGIEQLQPLVGALREVVLAQRVIHTDEARAQMLAPGRKKSPRLCLGLQLYAVFGTKSRGLQL
ncbi:hypothetical protein PS417_24985 [Pseudomonas simiae]|jgi:hypothetical protein|uniref:Transposase IS66 central domain-containing protein n=1 Tax=Pseudomonas simiae TaxID=321846 RepID=A0A1N7U4C1_9PSED|nr:hypothetical protein PS417_24985 [Pseudomonas simiae]